MTIAVRTKPRTASDIMSRDVVTVSPNDTLQDAMSLLAENHVTGLPVIDRGDRCVGVISMADILEHEREQSDAEVAGGAIGRYFNPDDGRWEEFGLSDFALEQTGQVTVSEVMSGDIICVRPTTSIAEVANSMLKAEVHRILVLDDRQFLKGIISSFDFVRLSSDL